MSSLRTLLLGETWALPLGITALAALSIAAHHAGLHWWPHAAGPLLLAGAIALVLATVWRTARYT